MSPRRTWQGHVCPTGGEAHGPLVAIRGVEGFVCIHSDHNGRPKSHPQGEAPVSRRIFPMAEVAER